VGSAEWVGNLDVYKNTYWSTFVEEDGKPAMVLDLADWAQRFSNSSFSVLGHSREAMRLGDVKVSAAEIETTILTASSEIIDCVAVQWMIDDETQPIAFVVLRENGDLTEMLTAQAKKQVHVELGETCVPAHLVQVSALPRTHNSKVMRNVVQQMLLDSTSDVHDLVSEIANPSCLLELTAAIGEWRASLNRPVLDQRI